MSIEMKNFFPELNHWIYSLITKSSIENKNINIPVFLESELWRGENSIFRVLFDETYLSMSYDYLFYAADLQKLKNADKQINRSLQIYGNYVSPFLTLSEENLQYLDTIETDINELTGVNYFGITEEDKTFLDYLCEYRLTNNIDVSSIVFDNIMSPLSKLIYVYLLYKTTQEVHAYLLSTETLSDSNNLLQVLFEKFIINDIYKSLSHEFNLDVLIDNIRSMNPTKNEELKMSLTEDQIFQRKYLFEIDKTPISEKDIHIIRNGYILVSGKDYQYNLIKTNLQIIGPDGIVDFKEQGQIEFSDSLELNDSDVFIFSWGYQTYRPTFIEE